jgi:hypothetical protein
LRGWEDSKEGLRGPPSYPQPTDLASPARQQRSGGLVTEPNRAEKIKTLATEASQALNADIFLLNSEIDPGIDFRLIKRVIQRRQKRPTVYLILVTEGGNADAGFRIARCLQSCYDQGFVGVVPGICKSTGTLMCIGAADLKIGDLGDLGPLDVQLAKPDELVLIASGLTIDSAFRGLQSIAFQMFENFLLDLIRKSGGRITTKMSSELAANLTVGLMQPIFAQVDPMKVGEDYRSTRIAEEYALRLHAKAQNLMSVTEQGGTIDTLVRGYPSHEFVIDRAEAKTLFRRVEPIPEPLLPLVEALGDDAIFARSSLRSEQPIIVYLNPDEAAHDQPQGKPPARGEKPGGGKRAASPEPKPAEPAEPLPPTPTKGDGNLAV